MTRAAKRQTVGHYRKAVLLLSREHMGIALDLTCPSCNYPEMAGVLSASHDFVGVTLCRKCGYAVTT